jgi:hypothetical protein
MVTPMKQRETLAELYLRAGRVHRDSQEYHQGLKVHEIVRLCLRPPDPRAYSAIERMPSPAERFVFDEDAMDMVRDMIKAGALSMRTMGETARMPTESVWMEYLDTKEQCRNGILVTRRVGDGKLLIVVVMEFEGLALPGMMIETNNFPWNFAEEYDDSKEGGPELPPGEKPEGGEGCLLLWEVTKVSRRRTWQRAAQLMHDALAMLFLLTVPRVCEVRTAVSRAERMRAREPRQHPAVEYKHVKLTIGSGGARYKHVKREDGETAEDYAKRFHRVMGHFRTYRHEYGSGGSRTRAEPLVRWIPVHWRGDPTKGILLHTRDVGTKKET